MTKITTKKFCAGCYDITDGERAVSVTSFSTADGASFTGWVAQAKWDRYLMSDPCQTKREAVEAARYWLTHLDEFRF